MKIKQILSGLIAAALMLGLSACNKAPTWEDKYNLGMSCLSEGNYSEAIEAFSEAIAIDPEQADTFVKRAYSLRTDRGGNIGL